MSTRLLDTIKRHKRVIYNVAISATIVAAIFVWEGTRKNAYALSVNGQVVAVVKEKEEAKTALEKLVEYIKETEGTEITLNEKIEVAHVNSKEKDLCDPATVEEALRKALSYQVEAYEIFVDGESYAIVESKDVAMEVLNDIAKTHLPEHATLEVDITDRQAKSAEVEQTKPEMLAQPVQEDTVTTDEVIEVIEASGSKPQAEIEEKINVTKVENANLDEEPTTKEGQKIHRELQVYDFNEEVIVKNTYVDKDDIMTAEQAKDTLLSNTDEVITYELKEGDNIWDVAMEYGTTMDRILEINPQITDETRMQIGEVIKVEAPDPVLSISTIERATFKELIPSEIEYVEFSDMYKDDTKVYQEGYDGLKEITVDVTKLNGKEVSRQLVSEKLIKEPKTKVIAYGTKERPKKATSYSNAGSSVSSVNSGMFMHPLNGAGRISSPYGSRWGSFHRGIDIAAPAGTPVYASGAGTVTYSGYNNGGFGKLVIIDHGNGYETYYAHNSSLYVNVGQKVSKGQNIAGVGSTGNSTGNHVHFEIRKNGTPINPYSYIY